MENSSPIWSISSSLPPVTSTQTSVPGSERSSERASTGTSVSSSPARNTRALIPGHRLVPTVLDSARCPHRRPPLAPEQVDQPWRITSASQAADMLQDDEEQEPEQRESHEPVNHRRPARLTIQYRDFGRPTVASAAASLG